MEEITAANNPEETVTESPENGNKLQENDSKIPENGNDSPETEPESEETEPSETPPSDWENASGEEEHPEESEKTEESDEAEGDPLSLRSSEFGKIIGTADGVLNNLVSMLHEKKQREGEMTIKISFEDADGLGSYIFSGAVSGKINYTVKPQKVIGDTVELKFDEAGRPILPADRERQLSFDDVPPAGATVTADASGVVQDVKMDPCKESECPFYGTDDSGNPGCCFMHEGTPDDDMYGDIVEALRQHNCKNPDVLNVYNTLTACAEESVPQEDAQPADACKNADCPFYDTDCEHNCQGRAEFQQCPGCVKDAVESCNCKNVNLLDVYNKLMEAEDHE